MPDIWMDVDAAVTVPVNIMPLIAVADFKTVLASETYNEAGLDLIWNFVTTAGVQTHTAITPTDTGGTYDWVNVGHGMYNIELPDSVNNTEGFGWFTGVATDALPWRGPTIGFRAAALNNALIDSAWSATRGLAGTALPDAAADAAGGLPISDAGGLNIDAILADTNELQTDWVNGGRLDLILDIIAADTTTDIPALINDLPTNAELATALGTADDAVLAELAKVPKSDSNVTWNATALASINAEVDGALNTAIPGSPTADSINERVKALDDLTQASGGGDLAAIKGYVDDIGVAGAGLTAQPWNAAWDAEVESEVNDALVALNLDHLIKVAKDTNWATTVTKESVIDLMTSKNSSQTYDRATDTLEATRDALTTVSAGVAATITATANTETTGTLVSGTYAGTYLSNGTYYTLAPVTPAVGGYGLNAYLTFGAASGQYINSVTIRGYFQNATGSARFCLVGAYNYVYG